MGSSVNILVLANKCDDTENLEVSEADIAQFEKDNKNIKIMKTSAKTGENVDNCFLDITKKLIVKKSKEGKSSNDRSKQMGAAFKNLESSKNT